MAWKLTNRNERINEKIFLRRMKSILVVEALHPVLAGALIASRADTLGRDEAGVDCDKLRSQKDLVCLESRGTS